MAKSLKIQQAIALTVALMLAAPLGAFAADGKKHYNNGLKFEENRQWDKAAQEYALAVSEKPSNVEYTLHLQRALVSAAIMLVERGDSLVEKKDYNAAYNAYRQAFSYDPTNELALVKMRRMLEFQGLPTDNLPKIGDPAGPSYKPRAENLKASAAGGAAILPTSQMKVQMPGIPGRRFSKTDVIYRDTNILTAIEQLAQMMKLNVVFDQMVVNQMKMIKITLELRDVTYPRALEMILKTNNLMYAQLDSRTIVVASDNPQQRMKYDAYAVRTFYIKNADIDQVKGAITGALSAQTKMTTVKQLNAIVVRDTPANLEVIENMIDSLDKSKAEVLIDVNIYEVSKNDLLQIGNQFTTEASGSNSLALPALGGINAQQSILGVGARTLTGPLGFALGLPNSSISFFQNKGKAKLLASTQIHVLDNEANTVRIGQRVPIQTASLPSYGTPSNQSLKQAANQSGVSPNDINFGLGNAFGVGIPQIQYENVGLNLDITPNVYEDDVQMKMKIETTSVDSSTGKFTPTFNQRTMSSVARVKDGQTTMVAGVSQNNESKTIKGIPLIGLIPILGRFFSTPETTNTQNDVVITVTPHILRRADITEKDHLARLSGDGVNATNQLKIEQILFLADQDDAAQNPVAEASPPSVAPPEAKPQVVAPPAIVNTSAPGVVVAPPPTVAPSAQTQQKPNVIKMTVSRPGIQSGAAESKQTNKALDDDDDDDQTQQSANPLMVYVRPNSTTATKGQDLYVAIFVNGNGDVSAAHITLTYDGSLLEVKGVRDSGMLSAGARAELQFAAEGGVLNIEMDRPQGSAGVPARGQLCLVVFSVKAQGQSPLVLVESQTQFRNSGGQPLPIKVNSSQVDIR
ncbi:MAG TPA: secretin N-terminal domain-containing protein [Blastocatellia bacterium]|nr:secretin N-terminal domain-containing protein [Blastocatellia bacterium]